MKLKILLVGNYLGNAANPSVGDELARQLQSQGNIIITVSHKSNRLARLIDMVITIWRRRSEYDLAQVDLFSGMAFLWAELACASLRMLRKPYILTLHGGNLPAFARRWPGRVKALLHSASTVTAPSDYLSCQMKSYREDIRLIPNPLDLSRYPYRTRLQLRPVLLWLRAFHHIYNPTLAPRVLSRLVDEFPDISLTMIGPDKKDGSLQATKRIASELGLNARISFPGGVPKQQVPEWMDKADVFINTTNFDNTPVSILEAMACGLCVVSTNVGGLPYLLQDGYDALLVPPDDVESMADAIRRLLQDADMSKRLSVNARAKAEEFDWSVMLPKWNGLIQETLNG